jgi:hypothetical protein
MKMFEAQCRCGAIGLRIGGEPVVQLYCRSPGRSRRRLCACGPLSGVDGRGRQGRAHLDDRQNDAKDAVRVMRHVPVFRACERRGQKRKRFPLPKGEFKPQFHVQRDDAILPVVDDLPHDKRFPAAFGGAETFVGW